MWLQVATNVAAVAQADSVIAEARSKHEKLIKRMEQKKDVINEDHGQGQQVCLRSRACLRACVDEVCASVFSSVLDLLFFRAAWGQAFSDSPPRMHVISPSQQCVTIEK